MHKTRVGAPKGTQGEDPIELHVLIIQIVRLSSQFTDKMSKTGHWVPEICKSYCSGLLQPENLLTGPPDHLM